MAKRPKPYLGEDDPTAGIMPGCHLLPQWWDEDLELQYGPSLSRYQEMCREWKQSVHSGGLWDEEEYRRMLGSRPVTKTGIRRDDEELMADFMADQSQSLSQRYQEAYILFFVNRMSYRAVASSMKITPENARKIVQRLRRKAKEWL